MASIGDELTNGHASSAVNSVRYSSSRFSDIPPAIDIVVQGLDSEEAVEIDLEGLPDDPIELCTLLENEGAARSYWMTIALAYAKHHKIDQAIDVLDKSLTARSHDTPKEKLPILTCLCWLDLLKSKSAPRIVPDGTNALDIKTKDYYLKASNTVLNEATRAQPSFPPLSLARGVICLVRALLQPPPQSRAATSQAHSERIMDLKQAMKSFDDALRMSGGKNMWALLGKARVQYALGKHAEALEAYQDVLGQMPTLIDPDPRIGIGCCMWQLGYKDDARTAWERAVEVNPESSIANVLLGIYHLDSSSHLGVGDPEFLTAYRKAMTECTQRAYKINKNLPLACSTFASYFYSRKAMPMAESLARKAIELTDVNAIASDGWYVLARKEHLNNDLSRASDYYRKADEARGGLIKGFIPAKLGLAQVQALLDEPDGAKLHLEKVIQQSKSVEAMILLGHIYAEEVFSSQDANAKDNKILQWKKAIANLESVRLAWKDSTKHHSPEISVLLTLARLYEDSPEKSRQCLIQVEEIETERLAKQMERPDGEDESASKVALRESLPPQLLNNLGCLTYATENFEEARATFQIALNACVKLSQTDPSIDTDALVTTISYNLARAYEAAGLLDEAKRVYEGLLDRHGDYSDALTRLAYIALRRNPTDEGPKMVTKLVQNDPSDLEARALYGWYLSKSKRRTANLAEDVEQRHYKHTLQHFDKHDRYALTGMGNLYLATAREMRRDSDSDREKRRKTYEKAVEFFDKALQLDPQNAYAAQGVAIALVEDRKDLNAAMQILVKVRDTIRDANVYINLGHVYTETRHYARAIECYETALAKDRGKDPHVLAGLGRVWLLRGKLEKSIKAMTQALDYSRQASEITNHQVNFKFNVAFIQMQIAQLMHVLGETQRTLVEVQAAAEGLEEAIESLDEVALSKNPPYPKHDIEQRANMGRNTVRKQLERASQSQREYEEKTAAKLKRARELRDEEIRLHEEKERMLQKEELERKRRITEARQAIQEQDRLLTEMRLEEERKKEEAEMETDSETGERRKKKKRGGKRKKNVEETTGSEDEDFDEGKKPRKKKKSASESVQATTDDNSPTPKKRKRLVKRSVANKSKFKSSERIEESDSENEEAPAHPPSEPGDRDEPRDTAMQTDGDISEEEVGSRPVRSSRRRIRRAISGSDDDDDDDDLTGAPAAASTDHGDNAPEESEANGLTKEEDDDDDVDMKDADSPTSVEAAENEEQ